MLGRDLRTDAELPIATRDDVEGSDASTGAGWSSKAS